MAIPARRPRRWVGTLRRARLPRLVRRPGCSNLRTFSLKSERQGTYNAILFVCDFRSTRVLTMAPSPPTYLPDRAAHVGAADC